MAIPTETKFESKGDLGTESIAMTIDEDGMPFLMSLLTNLYVDPAAACIREYCTNGIDAQIQNGYDGPVEVTLPAAYNTNLIIRDFGVGMSYEDIRDTYSKYVSSTKRQSNTQAGMFGIGSKSALAYGDRFTVTSVNEGNKVVCLISRVGRGAANIEIVSRSKTSERSGTTITIPVRNYREFTAAANKFFPYVKPGKFLVNGEERGGTFRGVKINDDLYTLTSDDPYSYTNNSYIVMGNVPYPIPSESRKMFVKYVPIGEFTPTPPREGLEKFDGYDQKIMDIYDEIKSSIIKSTAEAIDEMEPAEAANYILSNERSIGFWCNISDIKYKGTPLSTKLPTKNVVKIISRTKIADPDKLEYTLEDEMRGTHVVEYDGKDTPSDNTRAKCYRSSNSNYQPVFLHLNGSKPKFTRPLSIKKWDSVKQTSTSNSSYGGSNVHKAGDDFKVLVKMPYYDGYSRNTPPFGSKSYTKVTPADEYDSSKVALVYFSPTEITSRVRYDMVKTLMNDKGVMLVVKNANQFDKTKRDYPEAIHFNDYARKKAKALLDEKGQAGFLSRNYNHNFYLKFDGGVFDEFKKIASKPSASDREIGIVRHFAGGLLTLQSEYDTLAEQIEREYPLLSSHNKFEHNEIYVKALNAYKKETE